MKLFKRVLFYTVPVLLFFALVFLLIQIWPLSDAVKENPFLADHYGRPLIIAHRGGMDYAPENTVPAFDKAIDMGADVLELDLGITADGVLVPCHDLKIDVVSDGKGYLATYTYEELQQFNFGYYYYENGDYPYRDAPVRLPRLEELLSRYPDTLFMVEIKDTGELGRRSADALVQAINGADAHSRVVTCAFDDETLGYFRKKGGKEFYTSTAYNQTKKLVVANILHCDIFICSHDACMAVPVKQEGFRLDTPRLVDRTHQRNMAIQYWTINRKDEMRRLIELGADGIITDDPAMMKELLIEMGYSMDR